MKFGVVVFPGSNCDRDTLYALKDVLGQDAFFLWHKDHDLRGADAIVLPGGFAYGDYLRVGAIARFSPLMSEVKEFADRGGMVLGICNGFQVLLEMGLVEGVMIRNRHLKFLCQHVHIRVENERTAFTNKARKSQVLRLPIAHFDGNYFAPAETLEALEREGRVVFRYTDENGNATEKANVNGSLHSIAGIVNRAGNVMGLMPHPERASEELLGGADGRVILESMIETLTARETSKKKRS